MLAVVVATIAGVVATNLAYETGGPSGLLPEAEVSHGGEKITAWIASGRLPDDSS